MKTVWGLCACLLLFLTAAAGEIKDDKLFLVVALSFFGLSMYCLLRFAKADKGDTD